MDKSHEVADHLDRAADYIEEHGWCQRVFYDKGTVCLAGALSFTITDYNAIARAVDALIDYIGIPDIGGYNDTVLTNKADAVQTLRDAAVKARPDS